MTSRAGLTFRHRACGRCGGDALLDPREELPEWRCMLCARPVPEPRRMGMAPAVEQRRAA